MANLIKSPFNLKFSEIVRTCEQELTISSPFVNIGGVDLLIKSAKASGLKLNLLTNFSPKNILENVTQPVALLKLIENFQQVNIASLPRLHAKIYISDEKSAIVSSANLTKGGLFSNFEYGVSFDQKDIVKAIKNDLSDYFRMGNQIDFDLIVQIENERKTFEKIEKKLSKEQKAISNLLAQPVENIQNNLLDNWVKQGKTINAIFSDAILHLLSKHGELSTHQLNGLIQETYPDICDDSIERVCNGQNFGKKWKHSVRNAQVTLKKRGLIEQLESNWFLKKI